VREHLARIPTIVIHSGNPDLARAAAVAFRTATYGLAAAGTVYRADGVAIPLRAALSSRLPRSEEVLKTIERRARELKTVGGGLGE
jgi:formylmethanofuran dehydrogenase subunit B